MESYVNSSPRAEHVLVIYDWRARGMTIVRSCICSALFADPPDGRQDSVLLAASHASSPCVGISKNIGRSFQACMAAVSTVRRSKAEFAKLALLQEGGGS
jgi:hypothetical protein